jgi:hypothetical protein
MKSHINYFIKLLRHKYYVFIGCMKLGVPIYLALIHDIDKYLPNIWFPYVDNFYNKDGTSKSIRDKTGAYDPNSQTNKFMEAWIHHQKNKHHWQAWCSIGDSGTISPIDMPEVYIREMVADWYGAGKAYGNNDSPIEWYEKNKNKMLLTNRTRNILEIILYGNFRKE